MTDIRTSGFGSVPKGDTSSRSAKFPSPQIGDVYYNGELEILEIYNGTNWVAVSAPPSTPQIVSVTDASTGDAYTSTAGKLAVVFAPGSGGGTPSQYNAFTVSGGHSAYSTSTTVTLTGLTPATSYEVYGNGQNNFGTTVNTPNQAAVTPTTLPEVRTIGTATASTSANEVTVTWTNGNNGGKALSSITITPFLNGTTAETSRTAATTSSTSYTFTEGQLTAGSSYTFKVKATNANGTSADSTASNSATMPNLALVQYLVIAGGGAGGTDGATGAGGGGAGAGGYRSSVIGESSGGGLSAESFLPLTKNIAYTITVGAGGATNTIGSSSLPGKGSNSVLHNITSLGGGYGSAYSSPLGYFAAVTGGSGGGGNGYRGGSGTATIGAAGTPGQGYGGGNGTDIGPYAGPGGGGAGAGGANSTSNVGGNGGIGVASSITGTSVYRAGGGGGAQGNTNSGSVGAGGLGGGGAGGPYNGNSVAGTANTGGGAGGGNANVNLLGANGGSGIVIIKIPNTSTASFSGGVTQTMSTAVSGFKVYTITAAGVSDTVTIS